MEVLNIIICVLLFKNEAQATDEWPLVQAEHSVNVTAQVTQFLALLGKRSKKKYGIIWEFFPNVGPWVENFNFLLYLGTEDPVRNSISEPE